MAFVSTLTLDGRACTLVLYQPNWAKNGFRIGHSFPADSAEANTGIEGRAADRDKGLLTLRFRYTLSRAQAAEVLTALRAIGSAGKILVPLWPDARPAAVYSAQRKYLAQHTVNFSKVTGTYAIDASAGQPTTAGLLMGVLSSPPKVVGHTDVDETIEVEIDEDSPYSARIEPNTLAMSAWDLKPNWVTEPEETTRRQLKFKPLGAGREQSTSFDDAPEKLTQRAGFLLQSDDIRRLLTFWWAKKGSVVPFTVPQFLRPSWDRVPGHEPTVQARFNQDALVLDYRHELAASCKIEFVRDLVLGGSEPAQDRPSLAKLFKIWWEGSSTVATVTDWHTTITHSALGYTSAKIECKAPTENLRPGTYEWEFLLRDYAGCPLRAWPLLQLERKLNLEIRECDPTNPSAAVLRFAGTIISAPLRGSTFTARASLLGGALKRAVPNAYDQPRCNTTVFSDLCGLVEASWAQTGTVSVVAAKVVDLTTAAAQAAEYFAEGYAVFGTGDAVEVRYIARSAPITGGQRLTLHKPLRALGVGATVTFYPGCDAQFDGGCAKFSNQDNFFGFPHKPPFIEQVATGYKAKTGK